MYRCDLLRVVYHEKNKEVITYLVSTNKAIDRFTWEYKVHELNDLAEAIQVEMVNRKLLTKRKRIPIIKQSTITGDRRHKVKDMDVILSHNWMDWLGNN